MSGIRMPEPDATIMGAATSDVHTVELVDGARRWREKH